MSITSFLAYALAYLWLHCGNMAVLAEETDVVSRAIVSNLNKLKAYGLSHTLHAAPGSVMERDLNSSMKTCSRSFFVVITEYQFGNSGNQMVEFTHGLWAAHYFNATLIVPKYMEPLLTPFQLDVIKSRYCFVTESDYSLMGHEDRHTLHHKHHLHHPANKHHSHHMNANNPSSHKMAFHIEIESEQAFFAERLFNAPESAVKGQPELGNGQAHSDEHIYKTKLFPDMSEAIVKDMSMHFTIVYSLLWSSPKQNIIDACIALIKNKLNNALSFTAVHKRSMEGGCDKLMASETLLSEYDSSEIATDLEEWKGDLANGHPICIMSPTFISKTMTLNGHNVDNEKIFVAWDGKGDVSSYKSKNMVFSTDENIDKEILKFVDMMIGMHSSLFIGNPRSTFSFQIYVIRAILGLKSVPFMKSKDVYCLHESAYQEKKEKFHTGDKYDGRWVSYSSIQDSVANNQR